MQNSNSKIKIKDLDFYEFFEYLNKASPEDLDLFINNSETQVILDSENNYKTVFTPKPPEFPARPSHGQLYVHWVDKNTRHTYEYNRNIGVWTPTLLTAIQMCSLQKPQPPKPRKIDY
jgi:hypothetical protein